MLTGLRSLISGLFYFRQPASRWSFVLRNQLALCGLILFEYVRDLRQTITIVLVEAVRVEA